MWAFRMRLTRIHLVPSKIKWDECNSGEPQRRVTVVHNDDRRDILSSSDVLQMAFRSTSVRICRVIVVSPYPSYRKRWEDLINLCRATRGPRQRPSKEARIPRQISTFLLLLGLFFDEQVRQDEEDYNMDCDFKPEND